ncbi:MAG: NADH-quinone oxidoreductase subunit J [Syntrophomonas sp.]|nr:NADH-quinone oxidoreductase subunit J [Syntrophomonas sp.]
MGITLNDVVFVGVSGLTILAALGVVLSRNIIHSALALILAFLGVAVTFFQLGAGFIGLVQILVYAGAISVLIIFAIMLVMNVDAAQTNLPNPSRATQLWGALVALLLVIGLGGAIWFSELMPVLGPLPVADAVGAIAELLLGDYVAAFEAAAVLLLLAVVGAIILAKGVEEE